MTKNRESYYTDPLFQEALQNMQEGSWTEGLKNIQELKERYSDSIVYDELERMENEFKIKASFDQQEVEFTARERKRKMMWWGVRILILVAIAAGIYFSSSWLQKELVSVRVGFLNEVQSVEAAVYYRDAEDYLEADRPVEAKESIEKIREINPDFPELDQINEEVGTMLVVEENYQKALQLAKENQYQNALSLLAEVEEDHPGYKNVQSVIQNIQDEILLDKLLTEGEIAFQNEDWDTAVARYESVRALAPEFNTDQILDRLVESYILAAQGVLEARPESIEALRIAKEYFQKALILRPMDEDILIAQRRAVSSHEERIYKLYLDRAEEMLLDQEDSLKALKAAKEYFQKAINLKPNDPRARTQLQYAQAYLSGAEDFSRGRWDNVIADLDPIYEGDPGYAGGTARQMLFDAYLQRGEQHQAGGDYQEALEDFKRAAEIAEEKPEGGTIRLYWAKLKIAEVLGILGDFEQATQLYSDAVNLTNLVALSRGPDGDLTVARTLEEAERYQRNNWFTSAYRTYNRALPATEVLYSFEEYVIREGDYLGKLANEYSTTALSILDQNNISSPSSLDQGQTILIPILREPSQ